MNFLKCKSFKTAFWGIAAAALLLSCSNDLSQAEKFKEQGRYRSALESYLFFARAHPDHKKVPYALLEAGRIYLFNLHEPHKAFGVLKQLVANFPKSNYTISAQKLIADIAKNHLGDYRQAIVEYQRLIDIDVNSPHNAEYQLQIAKCYSELGDYKQAFVEYQALLKNYPSSKFVKDALYGIASSLYIQGRYEEAMDYYKKLLKSDIDKKTAVQVRFGLASCYEEMDEYDKALEEYRAIEKDYPTPAVVRIRINKIEERMAKRRRLDERKKLSGSKKKSAG